MDFVKGKWGQNCPCEKKCDPCKKVEKKCDPCKKIQKCDPCATGAAAPCNPCNVQPKVQPCNPCPIKQAEPCDPCDKLQNMNK